MSADPTGWIVRLAGPPQPRRSALCFAHAGGGANAWRPMAAALATTTEVLAVRLPAREIRLREPPVTSMADAAAAVADAVARLARPPDLLVGHSLGALLAYETVRELDRRRQSTPALLAVAGMRAPHLPRRQPSVHDAPDAFLRDHLARAGGIPQPILDNPDLLAIFLPALRADYGLHDTYRWTAQPPLSCAVAAFAGAEDPLVSVEAIAEWRTHAPAGFTLDVFPGGHFFPHTDSTAFAARLEARLAEVVGPGPSGGGR